MSKRRNYDQHLFRLDLSRFSWAVIYLAALATLLFSLFLLLSLFRISSTAFHCYDNIDDMPYHRVGLLLGTAPQRAPGVPNAYFTARIKAAAELYKKHKIDFILASGDNRALSYNEPREMRRALIKEGVPAERIVMDFAGIRTLDSIMRAKSVFMLQDLSVISQGFHNERALFIAMHSGLNADAFNAYEEDDTFTVIKVRIREFFARIKCILDIYMLETEPKFYGSSIKIGNAQMPVVASNKPRYATSKPKIISDNAAVLKEIERKALQMQHELELKALEETRLAQERDASLKAQEEQYNNFDEGSTDSKASEQSEQMSSDAEQQALKEAADNAANAIRDIDKSNEKSIPHKGYGDPWD